MEIENIVFDIGNVLLLWDPPVIYRTLFNRDDFREHPLSSIVGGEIWLDLDRGLITLEEGIKKATIGNEKYEKDIERFFKEAPYHFVPMEDTINLVKKCKELGYRIYLLSNFHRYGYEILKQRFSFFNYFNAGVISWEVGVNKPDRKIFEILLERYGLNPQNTVFIDDMEENIAAAQKLGIKGIHFTQYVDLDKRLDIVLGKE